MYNEHRLKIMQAVCDCMAERDVNKTCFRGLLALTGWMGLTGGHMCNVERSVSCSSYGFLGVAAEYVGVTHVDPKQY